MITTRKQGSKAISNKNIAFTAFAAFTAFTSNVKKCTTLSCVFSTQIFNADFQRRFSTQIFNAENLLQWSGISLGPDDKM